MSPNVFLCEKLVSRDLQFLELKRQLELAGASISQEISESDIIVEPKEDLGEFQYSFHFISDPQHDERSLKLDFQDINLMKLALEKITKLISLKREQFFVQKIELSLNEVRSIDIDQMKSHLGETSFVRLLTPFLSYYANRDWCFDPKSVVSEYKTICAELELDISLQILEKRDHEVCLKTSTIPYNDIYICLKSEDDLIRAFILSMILTLMKDRRISDSSKMDIEWDHIISSLSYPIAMFSETENELILHTQGFSKLNVLPRECLTLKDGSTIDIDGHTYEVMRVDFNVAQARFFSLTFNGKENISANSKKVISSEELGIISSSIAHELNNPIAGILASLTLLQLEDDLDDDTLKTLEEMEEGAKRCRDLIQVFLGFTKERPMNSHKSSFRSTFVQAISMLRFRMVESDCRLSLEQSVDSKEYSREINTSVMTMIFYLLMNEVITLYSHLKLVQEEQVGTIQGRFKESEDRFIIRFDEFSPIELKDKLSSFRLVQHLLDHISLKLDVEEDRIIIKEISS
ncbi:histidine kinase dimerization/phospho-acceptor domain-containing protein [Halobacteriovorax sp. GB3]|uniref:histidine kinase dimerization/phospho-acceptor domain-containing protein n=1 Tax=Halobacteriovorax sp. GB3 TaxID=2719615 RepID=UPI00236213D1|nr:histidine kinase dimerization/phospho-acceptor domain-containing protein [Halobacteriovorax sp. GB3]MDD0853877.1 histidine kinase dimerization/phospho-acceptor domain-containing protein [Halobacteriovorax sp. GB3]